MKSRVSFDMSSSVSRPVRPKSTSPTCSRERTRMLAGCGSAWKKPCRKIIVIQPSAIRYASRRRSVERPGGEVEIGELLAVELLERQHPRPRVAPVDARDPHVRVAGEVAVEDLGVAPLQPVVELLADRAGELVDELLGVDEVERADTLLRQPGGLEEQRQVGLDLPRRVRALHLDDDAAAVRQDGAVHLADRRGGERLLVELEEEPLDRLAELLLHDALDVGVREGTDVVLEPAQLDDDVRRHGVGPRREQLAELDEGRAELVQHLAQVLAARGGGAVHRRLDLDAVRGAAAGRSACAARTGSRSRA